MQLHTPSKKPDWDKVDSNRHNAWQRLAKRTGGFVTPGNILSVVGAILVGGAAYELVAGNWPTGVTLAVVGRLFDLADGYAADATGTKSSLGEKVDTFCDKLGVVAIVAAAFVSHSLGLALLILLIAYNGFTAIFGALWGRRYGLHVTRYGKLAAAASWVAVVIGLIWAHERYLAIGVIYFGCVTGFALLAAMSVAAYFAKLRTVSGSRVSQSWANDITEILYVFNPKATNYESADRLLRMVRKRLGRRVTVKDLNITRNDNQLTTYLESVPPNAHILVAIAGGDGTVSHVINTLAAHVAADKQATYYVLPLWGGNANDFACMLNGLRMFSSAARILARTAATPIPLIRLQLEHADQSTSCYACCYVSFGATAYVARQIDRHRLSMRPFLRNFPPLLLVREVLFVAQALLAAPLHRVEINKSEQLSYEHSLINGPRIAKINRMPVRLSESKFLHALVRRKEPAGILDLSGLWFRQAGTPSAKLNHVSFVIKNEVDAQIDGETMSVAAGTRVTATSTMTPLLFIANRRLGRLGR